MSNNPPAGWYPEPNNPGQQRYWDGSKWTEYRAPLAGASTTTPPATDAGAVPQALPGSVASAPLAFSSNPKPPWWRRWWAIAGAVAIVIFVIAAIAGGGASDTTATSAAKTESSPKAAAPSASPSPKSVEATKSTAPKVTKAKKAPTSKPALNPDAGVANRVKPGSAFRLGDFKIHSGWRIKNLGYGFGWEVDGLEVENVTNDSHQFDAEIKLHQGPHRIVADMDCIADEAQPGDIVEVNCLPDGSGKPYNSVTIENSF